MSITSTTIIRRTTPMAIGIPFERTKVLVVVLEAGTGGSVAVSVVDSNIGTTNE